MNLLEDIINELVDTKISLSSPLLKTKVFASRIDNQPLLKWVNNELAGYSDLDELPPYRIYFGSVYGTYINGRWKVENRALPTMDLPESVQDMYNKFKFSESVETLEKFNETAKGVISVPFTGEQIALLQQNIQSQGNPTFQILSARKDSPSSTVTQVLSVVRSQLLDFMLAIEKTFGSEVDIKTLRHSKEEVITIMNQTINNNGDGNVISTGANTNIAANIKVIKHNKESLINALHEQKVSEDDILALTNIIDTEKPIDNRTFGSKVQSWLSNMMTKSINGTWEIGVATAGGVLTEIINQYYGF